MKNAQFGLSLETTNLRAKAENHSIPKMNEGKTMGEYKIMVIVNIANVALVLIKGVAAYLSSSFSIGTSAIESFGDVFVSFLLLVQYGLDKKVKRTEYPRGRSSESTTNLTASVVMMALAFVNFIQSFDAILTGRLEPDIGTAHIAIIICNIAIKVFLFLICVLKRDHNQIRVLMRDQLTDVITNTIALVAVCLAHFYWNKFDFIGASIIFVLIVRNWAPIVRESWFKLQGIKGSEEGNKMVEKVIRENKHFFLTFAGYVTYHIGSKLIVEIYGEVDSSEHRAKVILQFNRTEVQAVYFLPTIEAKGMHVHRLLPNPNRVIIVNESSQLDPV